MESIVRAKKLLATCLLAFAACSDSATPDASTDAPAPGLFIDARYDAPPAVENQALGSDCSCSGADCDQVGVPKPAAGMIVGCDLVPTNWPGGARACFRSYDGIFATKTYFANGYCSIVATECAGAALICGSAVFGDYSGLIACPAHTVLIEDTQQVNVAGQMATVRTKLCAASCTHASDCRAGEVDPIHNNETTQYNCQDRSGVKFCYDARNLGASYTATAF